MNGLPRYGAYKDSGVEWLGDVPEVERSEAMKGIMRWVRLHPYNISQRVQVVVEHFRENVAPLLGGHAKAMVVVGSRIEAVRWQLAIEKYIRDNKYGIGTLVAFSGEVNDKESGSDPFTETSKRLNPDLRGRDMREAFATEEYQILLVANKFQTGFDQPLLCGMYVDKRLAGVQAVGYGSGSASTESLGWYDESDENTNGHYIDYTVSQLNSYSSSGAITWIGTVY